MWQALKKYNGTYESESCKRKTAEMNLQKMQQSQPPAPAEKRQRLLCTCTSAVNAEGLLAMNPLPLLARNPFIL